MGRHRQRDARHDIVLPGAKAHHRQPTQHDAEEHHHEQRQQEAWHADPNGGDEGRHAAHPPLLAEGRHRAEQHAHANRDAEGDRAQAHRAGNPGRDDIRDRPAPAGKGRAKITPDGVSKVLHILDVDGLVQPVLLDQLLLHVGWQLAGLPREGRARNGVHQEKGDGRQRQQRDRANQEPPQEISAHGCFLPAQSTRVTCAKYG